MHKVLSGVLAVAACIIAASCFEDPVAEKIAVRFAPEGHVDLTHQATFSDLADAKNARFTARLASVRDEYQRQQDGWSLLLARLEPPLDTVEWRKEEGVLRSVKQACSIERPKLQMLFASFGLGYGLVENEEWEEVSLYGAAPQSARREQRQVVTAALDTWSMALATYVDATRAVYDYIEANPSRAPACMAALFSRSLSEDEKKDLPQPTSAEMPLLARADEALNACTGVVSLGENDAYTLNEHSAAVYDPFAADFSITVPGEILETEGFTTRRDRTVSRQRASLWSALEQVEGKWLSPDPLITWIRRDRAGEKEPLSLATILAMKRSAARALSAGEVRGALEKELTFPRTLRVRWRRVRDEL